MSSQKAWARVEARLGVPASWIPTPGARQAAIFASVVRQISRPHLVPDAHLAALAIEHGLTLSSTDGDLARFKDPAREHPLAS